jgi:hypothetical protein
VKSKPVTLAWSALLVAATLRVASALADEAAVPSPKLSVGDTWTYAPAAAGRNAPSVVMTVVNVEPGKIVVERSVGGARKGVATNSDWMEMTYSKPWTLIGVVSGAKPTSVLPALPGRHSVSFLPGDDTVPFPLAVGAIRRQKVDAIDHANGRKRGTESVTTVKGREDVVVPAGRFRAIRIDRDETLGPLARSKISFWYVPEVRWHVQMEMLDLDRNMGAMFKLQSFSVH